MYTSTVLSPLCQRYSPSSRIQCRNGKCPGSPEAIHENPRNQECSRSNKISKRILSWPGSRATPAGYRGWINNKSRIILTSTYLLVLSAVLRVNAAATSRVSRECYWFLRRPAIVVIDVARDNKGAFAQALHDDAYFHSPLGKIP